MEGRSVTSLSSLRTYKTTVLAGGNPVPLSATIFVADGIEMLRVTVPHHAVGPNTAVARNFEGLVLPPGHFSGRRKLGQGGFGAVYRSFWYHGGVAVKELHALEEALNKSEQEKQGLSNTVAKQRAEVATMTSELAGSREQQSQQMKQMAELQVRRKRRAGRRSL